ncbi:MAG: RNA-directed polymerase, partial [Epulopiscium sp.]|nr:RNA-directed polymerase [Candidatus Epulonipiscium sp.]
YLRTLRCRGSDTSGKYLPELERAYFAQETVKRMHISKSEVAFCKEAVRSAHSTKNCTDNKTVHREGAQLYKRLFRAEEALHVVKWIMGKLELTLHSEKTRLVDMYFGKDSFDFFGFNNRFQRFRNKSWKWYWTLQQVPSQKAMKKMRANIKEVFASPIKLLLSVEEW